MPGALIEIEGFPQLAKALAGTGRDVRTALKEGLSGLAEPLARDAEQFALQDIRRMTLSWSRMRVGVTRGFSLTYVAPLNRGIKTRGPDPRRRPNLANLLRDRAMAPSVEKNARSLIVGAERLVDEVTGRRWAA